MTRQNAISSIGSDDKAKGELTSDKHEILYFIIILSSSLSNSWGEKTTGIYLVYLDNCSRNNAQHAWATFLCNIMISN